MKTTTMTPPPPPPILLPWQPPSLQPSLRSQIQKECNRRNELYSNVTIYGTTFSPPSSSDGDNDGDDDGGGRYLLACSSRGDVLVWDICNPTPTVRQSADKHDVSDDNYKDIDDDDDDELEIRAKKRRRQSISMTMNHDPIARFDVCNGTLYDLQILPSPNDDEGSRLLLTCGERGAFVFSWSAVLRRIRMGSNDRKTIELDPIATFRPNPPSSTTTTTEFNGMAYDETLRHLYCAAGGSAGGGYVYDLPTGTFLGTLGDDGVGTGPSMGRGRGDYLHAVRSVPSNSTIGNGLVGSHCILTGGEDGRVGIWDGKERKLVEMIDVEDSFRSDGGAGSGSGTSSSTNSSFWVSSIDVNDMGYGATIGGGIEHLNPTSSSTGRSSTHATPTITTNYNIMTNYPTPPSHHNGFIASLNLPTRTIHSKCTTRESIHSVKHHPNTGRVMSVGNEGVVSYWNPNDFEGGKVVRKWLTSSRAGYSMAVHPEYDLTVVGGVGRSVDCFSDSVGGGGGATTTSFTMNL